MSSETGGPGNELVLADRFDSCLTLLRNGESVETTLSRFPGSAAELRPLLETVESFRALPRYTMPSAAGSALLGQMLAQNAQFMAPQAPAAGGATPTQPVYVPTTQPVPLQAGGFRFNWFGRAVLVSKPLAAGAVLLVVAVVILAALVINNRSSRGPENEIAGIIEAVQPDRIVVGGQEIFIIPGETQLNNVPLQVGENVRVTVKNVNGKTQAQSVQLSTDLPTVTPVSNILPTVTPIVPSSASAPPSTTGPPVTATVVGMVTQEGNPTATPAPTIAPSPPPPPGTEEQVEGNITEIIINNNLTIIVIDNRQYILDPEVVKAYGPRLNVGIYIKFKGRYDDQGRIIVINLIQIDTEVLVVAPAPQTQGNSPGNQGDDKGKDDKNHQSNGNCDAHSDKGKCNGPEGGNGKGDSGGDNKGPDKGNGGGNKGGGNDNKKPKK